MPTFQNQTRTLHYRIRGEGPLVIFLPGNTAASAAHEGELEHLSGRYTAAALDFFGTGGSGRATVWPDDWFELAADDACALITRLGFEQAVLVGCSGSGQAAMLAALRHPGQVAGLVVDSSMERFPATLIREDIATRDNPDRDLAAFWQLCHGEDWDAVVRADSGFLLRFAGEESAPVAGRLGEITCPTLITACRGDKTIPNAAGEALDMALKIPEGRSCIFEGGDHPAMWSVPDQFRAALDEFLAEILPCNEACDARR